VPDDNFESYLESNGMGDGVLNNDSVLKGNINTVQYLNVNVQNINNLEGIQEFDSLQTLYCLNNQLTSLDVSQNIFLTQLNCQNNELTSLDLSQNILLTQLNCQNNELTSLDLSQNILLTQLGCSNNQLASLDVSQNTSLGGYLYCENNQLTSLDLGNNTALTHLICHNNQLTSLDVSQNTSLHELNCQNNQLTSLDLSQNTSLGYLYCEYNQLTSLDLGSLFPLTFFMNTNNNTNLFCIDVDDPSFSSLGFWNIDPWTSFDTNCIVATGCLDSLSCNYDSIATIDDNSCFYLPVSLNNTEVTCANYSDAILTVISSLGTYSYLWSNGETTQSIDSLPLGSYNVIVTDSIGCSVTLNADVALAMPPASNMYPEICYVTVDSMSTNNKIRIKQMANVLASKVVLYKESSTNIFLPIDTIDHNTLEYLDINSNTMIQSYRYKVSVIDTCGNESLQSPIHKSIHLIMSTGINGEINLLWNNYEGYQPNEYLIFRSVNNGPMNQIGVLPGTNLAFTDLTPPTGNLIYQVRAIVPTCNIIPFTKNKSIMIKSNIINYNINSIIEYDSDRILQKTTDILGRETKEIKNRLLFYIYDDGTVKRKIILE